MHVCDITHTEPAVASLTLTIDNNEDDRQTVDLGPSALAAVRNSDFFALGQLVPRSARAKDPKKSAAAKKAAVTRKSKNKAPGPDLAVVVDGPDPF